MKMKVLNTMQRSLKWMLFLLVCVIVACVVLGGLFIKQKLDDRAARQAEYDRIASEKADEITLTFLPGNTVFTAKRMLAGRGFSEEDIAAAFSKQYDTMTRLGRPATVTGMGGASVATSVEGFLFPETLNFYATATVESIVTRMASELDRAVQSEGLVQRFGDQNLTFYQGLILASIVESEIGGNQADAAKIAAIFYNRLRAGWTLGADATAIYAANLAGVAVNNPDGSPNYEILQLDSPWNTRKRAGLPPTPISSPSIEALRATANPAISDMRGYYYFLTGDDGSTYFARTEAEHQQNIREHCQVRCANW
jgi:UPF0755 protein